MKWNDFGSFVVTSESIADNHVDGRAHRRKIWIYYRCTSTYMQAKQAQYSLVCPQCLSHNYSSITDAHVRERRLYVDGWEES